MLGSAQRYLMSEQATILTIISFSFFPYAIQVKGFKLQYNISVYVYIDLSDNWYSLN